MKRRHRTLGIAAVSGVILALGAALFTGGAAQASDSTEQVAEQQSLSGGKLGQGRRVTALENTLAVSELGRCYGRAQDVLYRTAYREGREQARAAALPHFQECFTDDAQITFTFFGNPDSAVTFNGLDEWLSFVLDFSQENAVSSTRHLIGNETVELTGRRTATLEAYGNTPHFQAADLAEPAPSNITITGAYLGEARLTRQGWRLTEFRIDAEEIQNVVGSYPFGFAPPAGS